MPFLAAAIKRFLQEYPWTTDGLSRSERRLLQQAAGGGIDLSAASHGCTTARRLLHHRRSMASLAETLSRTSPPLLACGPGSVADGEVLQGSVTLTDSGRAVLGGQRDRVDSCGIDRWLGGVRLHGDTALWRWDDQHDRITQSR